MDYTYSYLIGDLVLVVLWIALYAWRSDVRREMLVVSGFFGFAGMGIQPFLRTDWWQPLTITHTSVGLEDFLYGACFGGLAAVLYEVVFKRRIRVRKSSRTRRFYEWYILVAILSSCAALFFGLFAFGFSTFVAASLALLIPTGCMWIHRHDLIVDSIASGVLAVIAQWFAFWVVASVTPGYVEQYWLLNKLSGIIILAAPLEDVVWAFCAGMFIGPLYEFWKETRLTKFTS